MDSEAAPHAGDATSVPQLSQQLRQVACLLCWHLPPMLCIPRKRHRPAPGGSRGLQAQASRRQSLGQPPCNAGPNLTTNPTQCSPAPGAAPGRAAASTPAAPAPLPRRPSASACHPEGWSQTQRTKEYCAWGAVPRCRPHRRHRRRGPAGRGAGEVGQWKGSSEACLACALPALRPTPKWHLHQQACHAGRALMLHPLHSPQVVFPIELEVHEKAAQDAVGGRGGRWPGGSGSRRRGWASSQALVLCEAGRETGGWPGSELVARVHGEAEARGSPAAGMPWISACTAARAVAWCLEHSSSCRLPRSTAASSGRLASCVPCEDAGDAMTGA